MRLLNGLLIALLLVQCVIAYACIKIAGKSFSFDIQVLPAPVEVKSYEGLPPIGGMEPPER